MTLDSKIDRYWRNYLDGKATEQEMTALLAAFDDADHDLLIQRWLAEQWDQPILTDEGRRADSAYKKVLWERIRTRITDRTPSVKTFPRRTLIRRSLAAAASIILLIGFYVMHPYFNRPSYTVLTVKSGEPAREFILPDQTSVWINSASTVRYVDDFRESRRIYLQGEAFFSVARDERRPFVVKTGQLSTQVLGTQFNIKEEGDNISVTVSEGLVKVYHEPDTLLIKADQQAVFDQGSGRLTARRVNPALFDFWSKEKVVLNDVTMDELMAVCSQMFNIQYVFRDYAARQIRISVSLDKHDNLQDIIEKIDFINEVQIIKKKGNMIEIASP